MGLPRRLSGKEYTCQCKKTQESQVVYIYIYIYIPIKNFSFLFFFFFFVEGCVMFQKKAGVTSTPSRLKMPGGSEIRHSF